VEVKLDEVAQLEPELEAKGAGEGASNVKSGPLTMAYGTRTRRDGKVLIRFWTWAMSLPAMKGRVYVSDAVYLAFALATAQWEGVVQYVEAEAA